MPAVVKQLMDDPKLGREMAARARGFLEENKGVTQNVLDHVEATLAKHRKNRA